MCYVYFKLGSQVHPTPVPDPLSVALANLAVSRDRKLSQFYNRAPIVAKGPVGETPNERYTRSWQNWQCSATLCVTDSSATTYSTGVRMFLDWCMSCNVDPTFITPPSAFDPVIAVFDHKLTSFLCFLGYLAHERGLHPGTVSVYKCGVVYWFKTRFIEHDFMLHPIVAQLSASLRVQWNGKHEAAEKRRLPFTIEMLSVMNDRTLNLSKPLDHAVIVGTKLGLVVLLRAGEMIPSADNHFLREDDVSFLMRSTTIGVSEFFVSSGDAHLFPLSHLVGVTIFVRSAKNDQDGQGHRYHFETMSIADNVSFCFASDLFSWAQRARLHPGDPFLAFRGDPSLHAKHFWLKYRHFVDCIKRAAFECGFDPLRFSSHSLRIGGATILAAAGLPNHYIQTMGRWKSLAFLAYIHIAVGAMSTAIKTIVNPKWFPNAQLRVLNPKAG